MRIAIPVSLEFADLELSHDAAGHLSFEWPVIERVRDTSGIAPAQMAEDAFAASLSAGIEGMSHTVATGASGGRVERNRGIDPFTAAGGNRLTERTGRWCSIDAGNTQSRYRPYERDIRRIRDTPDESVGVGNRLSIWSCRALSHIGAQPRADGGERIMTVRRLTTGVRSIA